MKKETFDKIRHAFMRNVLERVGLARTYLNIIKAIYDTLEIITLKSELKQGCPPSPLLFNSKLLFYVELK